MRDNIFLFDQEAKKNTTFDGYSFIIGALPHISMLREAFNFFASHALNVRYGGHLRP